MVVLLQMPIATINYTVKGDHFFFYYFVLQQDISLLFSLGNLAECSEDFYELRTHWLVEISEDLKWEKSMLRDSVKRQYREILPNHWLSTKIYTLNQVFFFLSTSYIPAQGTRLAQNKKGDTACTSPEKKKIALALIIMEAAGHKDQQKKKKVWKSQRIAQEIIINTVAMFDERRTVLTVKEVFILCRTVRIQDLIDPTPLQNHLVEHNKQHQRKVLISDIALNVARKESSTCCNNFGHFILCKNTLDPGTSPLVFGLG